MILLFAFVICFCDDDDDFTITKKKMELSNVVEEHKQTLAQLIINTSQHSCYVVEVTTSMSFILS